MKKMFLSVILAIALALGSAAVCFADVPALQEIDILTVNSLPQIVDLFLNTKLTGNEDTFWISYLNDSKHLSSNDFDIVMGGVLMGYNYSISDLFSAGVFVGMLGGDSSYKHNHITSTYENINLGVVVAASPWILDINAYFKYGYYNQFIRRDDSEIRYSGLTPAYDFTVGLNVGTTIDIADIGLYISPRIGYNFDYIKNQTYLFAEYNSNVAETINTPSIFNHLLSFDLIIGYDFKPFAISNVKCDIGIYAIGGIQATFTNASHILSNHEKDWGLPRPMSYTIGGGVNIGVNDMVKINLNAAYGTGNYTGMNFGGGVSVNF